MQKVRDITWNTRYVIIVDIPNLPRKKRKIVRDCAIHEIKW
jgi:hypothetical protein